MRTPTLVAIAGTLLLAACGTGAGRTGADDAGVPADLPGEPGAADAPDLFDPGPPLPDLPDVPDLSDVLDLADLPDGPDAPEVPVPECQQDADCVGRLIPGPCQVPRCSQGTCVAADAADDLPCDPGDPCVVEGRCAQGLCRGVARDCGDDTPCTDDWCKALEGCRHDPVEGPCDDGNACTTKDRCQAGACVGEAASCDDGNPCTIDSCDPAAGCAHEPVGSGPCSDGNACTLDDACVAGVCRGTPAGCDDRNVCTRDLCDPVQGCRHEPAQGPCSDGFGCTRHDRCQDGLCVGQRVDCEDGDACTDDACQEGTGCRHDPNAAPCDDLSPCTTGDTCAQGACAGTPVACDAPPANECQGQVMVSWARQGACGTAGCAYQRQDVPCAEGCADGRCVGDPCAGVDCGTPPGPCFEAPGQCDAGSCSFAYADGRSCDDGNPCSEADACGTGVCAGRPRVCNHPPAPACLDPNTARSWDVRGRCVAATGECEYDPRDIPCPGGCMDGVCAEALDLLQADLDAGGRLGMSAADRKASCVLPGWLGGQTAKSSSWSVRGGFEP